VGRNALRLKRKIAAEKSPHPDAGAEKEHPLEASKKKAERANIKRHPKKIHEKDNK